MTNSIETNPRDQVKLISTTKADFSEIRRIGYGRYIVLGTQHRSLFSETAPFPRRLQNFGCDNWREAQDVKILDAYDHTMPQKEKTQGALAYLVLFIISILIKPLLTIELADRTIKQPRGIAENVLVRIRRFIFPIDFIILDIPEDDDVPLIPRRPFLSTAHSKIDVFKRKINLRDKYEGKSHAGTLIDMLVFVGSFSIISGFTIIDDDDMTKEVVLGMKFCKKYASCQMIMKKFALGDKCERIMENE
ncbi:hypothetical protein Tco_0846433 [Tanacetum coccineum]